MAERAAKKPKSVSDWANRPARPESSGAEQRRRLSEALSAFIHGHGGWVVSVPGSRKIRIEIPQGSALPVTLTEFGYPPRQCGVGTRIITARIVPVDIIEIKLGG
jgi:hypothetical protein